MDSPKEQKSITDYLDYIGVSTDVVFSAIDALTDGKNPFKEDKPPPKKECTSLFKGATRKIPCDQKTQFICEDPEQMPMYEIILNTQNSYLFNSIYTYTRGLEALLPLDSGIKIYLNFNVFVLYFLLKAPYHFVGGKNYVVPAEKVYIYMYIFLIFSVMFYFIIILHFNF